MSSLDFLGDCKVNIAEAWISACGSDPMRWTETLHGYDSCARAFQGHHENRGDRIHSDAVGKGCRMRPVVAQDGLDSAADCMNDKGHQQEKALGNGDGDEALMWSMDGAAAAPAAATDSEGEEDGRTVATKMNRLPRDAGMDAGAGLGWNQKAIDVREAMLIFLPRPFQSPAVL